MCPIILSHPGIDLSNQIDKNDPGNIIINEDNFLKKWLKTIEKRILLQKLNAHIHVGMADPLELEKAAQYYSEFARNGASFHMWYTGQYDPGERLPVPLGAKQSTPSQSTCVEQFFVVDHPDFATAVIVNGCQGAGDGVTLPKGIIITNPRLVQALNRYLSNLETELQYQDRVACQH